MSLLLWTRRNATHSQAALWRPSNAMRADHVRSMRRFCKSLYTLRIRPFLRLSFFTCFLHFDYAANALEWNTLSIECNLLTCVLADRLSSEQAEHFQAIIRTTHDLF